ncbi:hypothetical protein URH17368_0152 [Alicyclobacillus hesperidum URH17-3-68]|nr:hypothetical protein URH17368_0152 [Alicyclobacillus hesperidum URH17-3-68]
MLAVCAKKGTSASRLMDVEGMCYLDNGLFSLVTGAFRMK